MRVALLLRQVSTQHTLLLVGGFALLVLLQNGAAQLVLVALLRGHRLSLQVAHFALRKMSCDVSVTIEWLHSGMQRMLQLP